MINRRTAPLLLGLACLLANRPCAAWPEYPAAVAQDWRLATQPPCTICHQTDQGGPGTATKPFARNLQQQGLGAASDTGLLASVLEQTKDCQTDSDGDGVPDFTEVSNLTASTDPAFADPNDGTGDPTSLCGDPYDGPTPRTGCTMSPNDARASSGSACAALFAVATFLRRRKARRYRRAA